MLLAAPRPAVNLMCRHRLRQMTKLCDLVFGVPMPFTLTCRLGATSPLPVKRLLLVFAGERELRVEGAGDVLGVRAKVDALNGGNRTREDGFGNITHFGHGIGWGIL
jgi:hypothetical protein